MYNQPRTAERSPVHLQGIPVDTPSAISDYYLSSNEAPSALERQSILASLDGPSQRLHDVDQEIRELEGRLEDLRRRKAPLVAYIQKYRPISSLIRRLPDNILREVFRKCLSTERYPVVHVAEAPLLLTIICKRWREIALETPELWTKAHIQVDSLQIVQPSPDANVDDRRRALYVKMKAGEDGRFALLRMFLGRAGSLPLCLSIQEVLSRGDIPPDEMVTSSALKWVLALAPRLKSIRWVPKPYAATLLRLIPPEEFSELEELKTYWQNRRDGVGLGGGLPPFCLAPRLRDVEILGSPTQLAKPLRWSQLTNLAMHTRNPSYKESPDIPFVVELLSTCQKLQTLTMCVRGIQCTCEDGMTPAGPGDTNKRLPERLILESLWSLRLYYWYCIDNFLKILQVPELSELFFNAYDAHPARSTSLSTFISCHSYCLSSIERLDVTALGYRYLTLVSSLEQLPRLRHLVILNPYSSHKQSKYADEAERFGFHEDLLVRMTPRMPEIISSSQSSEDVKVMSLRDLPCLCPLLQQFEFYEHHNYLLNRHLSLDTVSQFVAGKWEVSQQHPNLVSRLRHITVPTRTLPEKKVSRGLKEWREKTGLGVKIAEPFTNASRTFPSFEDV